MTPKMEWQDGKADRAGEPVNQEELSARGREHDNKKQKAKSLGHNTYRNNQKNVGHRIQKLEQSCLSGIS